MRKTASIIVVCLCMLGALMLGLFVFGRPEAATLGGARAVAVPGSPGTARVYLQVENGAAPDRLLGASSAAAQRAVLVGARGNGELPIPANGTAVLSGDGVHLLLTGIDGVLEEGRLIPVALEFARSGRATTRAEVQPSGGPHDGHDMPAAPAAQTGPAGPSVRMEVAPADGGGWDVRLITRNFAFDPESDAPVHVPGHGHGHLYVNGLKIRRMYSRDAVIGALPPGMYEVLVTLHTNTHAPYTTGDGKPVAAAATINVE